MHGCSPPIGIGCFPWNLSYGPVRHTDLTSDLGPPNDVGQISSIALDSSRLCQLAPILIRASLTRRLWPTFGANFASACQLLRLPDRTMTLQARDTFRTTF